MPADRPRTDRPRMAVNRRIVTVAIHDLFMAALSFELAVGLAFWNYGNPQPPLHLWPYTMIFVGVSAPVFSFMGLYRGIWHYASFNDLVAIAKGVSLALLVFFLVLFVVTRAQDLPRAALILQWPILFALLAGPRLLYRAMKDGDFGVIFDRKAGERIPVLLIGAGIAAETFIRDMARRKDAPYRVVGLLDEKASRIGRDMHGIRVLGGIGDLAAVTERLAERGRAPQRIVITAEQLDGGAVRRLLDEAERLGLTLARLPRLTDFKRDDGAPVDIRPVDVEDLLGRPQKVLDRDAMRRLIEGRRVLVTGAGGTIGSELARQIADLKPLRLALLDNSEHNLYQIDLELGETRPNVPRAALLGDVRDRARLGDVFRTERPELVFHAAAFKHLPLVEENPAEGVLTNVTGTRNVADLCRESGVAAMVMISTDKAVNPSSIMGASKRIAEIYCQALSLLEQGGRGTRFVTVRFGNVLGSTGSVVPLFQRQLARGGPLTVTHPDVTRYFMTTREAVELTLQASAMTPAGSDERGKIFVLDMGEPVRIQDLARQMIRLAGFRPDVEVQIVYTDLRQGEKLHEEVLHKSEHLVPTAQDGILLAAPRLIDHGLLVPLLDQLAAAAEARRIDDMLALVRRIVPEYAAAVAPKRAAGP
ncbi:MAG TPA: nucleoside-diphosphate sugar epimerase/dehydratase [Candidatus Cybelea sp.]|nr:nucleoside-diphosphate sugar epimerase/dehydratase [Candidatus Cybelea sp.]